MWKKNLLIIGLCNYIYEVSWKLIIDLFVCHTALLHIIM